MNISTSILGKTGLQVSRLGLGTVEIGLPYGIGVTELPSEQEAERILKTAIELGITYFDTARGYGVAEERIGKSGITKMEGIVVGTKCAQFLKQEPNLHGADLEKRIRQDIDTSRKFLKQDALQLVQLHIELPEYTDFRALIDIMQRLKDEEKVLHVGIALRGEMAALAAIDSNFFETIQLAHSIVDQRMVPKVLPLAQEKNIGIINRSVLLRGVLTSVAETLPDELADLQAMRSRATQIAHEAGMDLPTLAMRYVISHEAVSTALLGTTHPAELKTALAAVEAGPLPEDVLTELRKLAINDPKQVDPGLWPNFS